MNEISEHQHRAQKVTRYNSIYFASFEVHLDNIRKMQQNEKTLFKDKNIN